MNTLYKTLITNPDVQLVAGNFIAGLPGSRVVIARNTDTGPVLTEAGVFYMDPQVEAAAEGAPPPKATKSGNKPKGKRALEIPELEITGTPPAHSKADEDAIDALLSGIE